MCGIVGYIGRRDAAPILLQGLHQLEYRGYDSAGIATVDARGLSVVRTAGRVTDLEAALPKRMKGSLGIGHTRWATHGEPSERNAHPHTDAAGDLALVHNGIVENADDLRRALEADGVVFASDTDTEVLAHLIARAHDGDLVAAVRTALAQIAGTYGLAVIDRRSPDLLVAARNGSPVVIGIGDKEMYLASDAAALVAHTSRVVHLEDGQVAAIRSGSFETTTLDALPVAHEVMELQAAPESYALGDHEHFMHKEIAEQPSSVARLLQGRIDHRFATAHLGGLDLDARELLAIRRVKVIGCGSALYAGRAGAQLVEELARIPCEAEVASEHLHRNPVIEADTLYVAVSQSGETYDTIAAVHEIARKGGRVLGVVNTVGSTLARACGSGIYLHAGPEVSVTSTKTYTSTALAFALLGLHLGRVRDLGPAEGARLIEAMTALPDQIASIVADDSAVAAAAASIAQAQSAFFIGRVRGYPVALEGAQKLKEVSYLHAEAYQAGELKHGPLALISPEIPTVAIVPDDDLLEKNLSTVAEIRARRGPVLAFTHEGVALPDGVDRIDVPRSVPALDPILLGIPLQLLAYHAALHLGRDVDRPRNLAKSVTVG